MFIKLLKSELYKRQINRSYSKSIKNKTIEMKQDMKMKFLKF